MRLKKVKNALERIKQSEYFVDNADLNKTKWKNIFNNNNPIHIEIGMGKGDFIIGMAKQNRDINYIGIEMYDSVMVKAIEKLKEEEKLYNLKLILLDASKINEVFDPTTFESLGYDVMLINDKLVTNSILIIMAIYIVIYVIFEIIKYRKFEKYDDISNNRYR